MTYWNNKSIRKFQAEIWILIYHRLIQTHLKELVFPQREKSVHHGGHFELIKSLTLNVNWYKHYEN